MDTRACQNCKQDFAPDADDMAFYKKMGVPAPTFCRECRMVRRMLWRNVRSLHRRECSLCKKVLISMYAGNTPVFCTECYAGDGWDRYAVSSDIDWTRDIFSQINALLVLQPRVYQYRLGTVINSDYGNSVVNTKDAYLAYSVIECDNIMYSESVDKTKDSMECFACIGLDQCSWNICSEKNYNSHHMFQTQSCIDSQFLFDCVNCQQCCLSSNMRNQQYVFRNKKLSKEEYEKAVSELRLDTISGLTAAKEEFRALIASSIHKYAQNIASQNVTGDFISHSKDIKYSFDVAQSSEDISYSSRIISSKDIKDCYAILTGEREYECLSGSGNASNQIACVMCLGSRDLAYSLFCINSADCFGCVGLKNAQYCILNKQYSKDEYQKLIPKLREHMMAMPYVDAKGRSFGYGEFYPYDFAMYAYNETIAQDNFPITEDIAKERGYPWKVREKRSTEGAISASELSDAITDVSDDILKKTILCLHAGECGHQCTEVFKVIDRELAFYRAKNLPLPTVCPNCRHYERLGYRNTFHLYSRSCMCTQDGHEHAGKCLNRFETSYAPDRPELVYCESCYQKEVI